MKKTLRNLKIIAVLTLALTLLCSLSSCGSSNKFTVDYVGTAGVLSANVIIVGQYKGEETKLAAFEAFKDCTFVDMEFIGDTVTLSGTEDGNMKYDNGVILKLKDADGQTHSVEVKDGSEFELEELEDGWHLLLPE